MSVLFTDEMAQKILDAINMLNSNLVSARGGALSNLSTTTKSSIIAAINELVNANATINTKLDRIYTDNAAAHNAVYRGKNLGTSITADQIAAIRDGSYSNIYPGDFWRLGNSSNNGICLVVAHLFYFYGYNANHGGALFTKQNLVALAFSDTFQAPMNDTASNSGGLYGAKMYTDTLPEILTSIRESGILGNAEILTVPKITICDAITDGKPSHFVDADMNIFLPTCAQIYGTYHENTSYPHIRRQFAVYKHIHPYELMRESWMIKNPGPAWTDTPRETGWYATAWGIADELIHYDATDNAFVVPYILIG